MVEIKELYSKRAKRYDLTSKLYYLVGVRVGKFRKKAVQALRLHRGSRVVLIRNFSNTGLLYDD